jgi:hypothetical protein
MMYAMLIIHGSYHSFPKQYWATSEEIISQDQFVDHSMVPNMLERVS